MSSGTTCFPSPFPVPQEDLEIIEAAGEGEWRIKECPGKAELGHCREFGPLWGRTGSALGKALKAEMPFPSWNMLAFPLLWDRNSNNNDSSWCSLSALRMPVMRLKAYTDCLILSSQPSWEAGKIITLNFWIGNGGSEQSSHWPEVTQLESRGGRIWMWTIGF